MDGAFLAYVQYFSRPKPTPEKNINMYVVSREDRRGVRRGAIIPLDSIVRFVQLVPKFGATAHPILTAENSADVCRDFYVNSFADKEVYQAVCLNSMEYNDIELARCDKTSKRSRPCCTQPTPSSRWAQLDEVLAKLSSENLLDW
ncbi:hypothetical protein FRC16_003303 [Serendipita sp. 398]|nr:hypothetical protein FRC16_003303 [Serendipita sp. 398]